MLSLSPTPVSEAASTTLPCVSRNRAWTTTVLTEIGPVYIDILQDVNAPFVPQIVNVTSTPADGDR
jgi:hypothetical protein